MTMNLKINSKSEQITAAYTKLAIITNIVTK